MRFSGLIADTASAFLLRSITRFIAICCAHAHWQTRTRPRTQYNTPGPQPRAHCTSWHAAASASYFTGSRAAAAAASANPLAMVNAMPCVLLYARWKSANPRVALNAMPRILSVPRWHPPSHGYATAGTRVLQHLGGEGRKPTRSRLVTGGYIWLRPKPDAAARTYARASSGCDFRVGPVKDCTLNRRRPRLSVVWVLQYLINPQILDVPLGICRQPPPRDRLLLLCDDVHRHQNLSTLAEVQHARMHEHAQKHTPSRNAVPGGRAGGGRVALGRGGCVCVCGGGGHV